MDMEAEQCKEVFALYGLAMYQAQCLERQIAISLASVFGPKDTTQEQYDSLLESNFEKTMGKLIYEFVSANKSDARARSFEADLRRARDIRNLLAHNYFWQRAAQFVTASGREAMIAELTDSAELFAHVDDVLARTTMAWAERHGVSQSDIREAMGALLDQSRPRWS